VPAYAASASALIVVLSAMATQTEVLARQVEQGFGQHPDAEVYLSQLGLGSFSAPGCCAEFGDDPDRYADAKGQKNYSGMSPITKASGTKRGDPYLIRTRLRFWHRGAHRETTCCHVRPTPGVAQ
jgi:hypothetical protein